MLRPELEDPPSLPSPCVKKDKSNGPHAFIPILPPPTGSPFPLPHLPSQSCSRFLSPSHSNPDSDICKCGYICLLLLSFTYPIKVPCEDNEEEQPPPLPFPDPCSHPFSLSDILYCSFFHKRKRPALTLSTISPPSVYIRPF